eukprot:5642065-Karenia_brevis.AAC.1
MLNKYIFTAPPIITGFQRLVTCFLVASDDSKSGLTWLELFLLAVALCDSPLTLIRSNTAKSQKPLVHQLREFAAHATKFLKFALVVPSQCLFAATHVAPNRLQHYGYHTRLTHTKVHIKLSNSVRATLDFIMLSLRQPLPRDQIAALGRGNLRLKLQ